MKQAAVSTKELCAAVGLRCQIVMMTVVLLGLAGWFELLDSQADTRLISIFSADWKVLNVSGKSETEVEQPDDFMGFEAPPPPVGNGSLFIQKLRQARLLASNGRLESISDKERAEWNRQNPCSSRVELQFMYDDRTHTKRLPNDPAWREVLDEYSELHRACMKRVGNVTDYYLQRKDTVPGCKFIIADVESGAGLGNKILVLASAFAYALATQRILLVASMSLVHEYACEPFVGSSWHLDTVNQVRLTRSPNNTWQSDGQFLRTIRDHARTIGKQNIEAVLKSTAEADYTREWKYNSPNISFPFRPQDYAVVASPDRANSYQAHPRFYCEAEQDYYSYVPFVMWSGCINTIPKIFTTLRFMPAFEALFPNRMILTRILRAIVLPDEVVWGRVKHVAHAYLLRKDRSRRVGIQMRFRDRNSKEIEPLVDGRVLDCLWKEGILPNASQPISKDTEKKQNLNDIKNAPVVKVYIASLLHGLYDYITKAYLDHPATVTGEDVSLVQLTSARVQGGGIDEDREAFTEILLLSMSDQLLVTPISTFGGLAQAYGALVPWFIEYRQEFPDGARREQCVRSETIGVAHQAASVLWSCDLDRVPRGNLTERAPYLRPVLDIELSNRYTGIHLVTDF